MTKNLGEFKVMTSGTFAAAHLELISQLEQLTKKRIVTASTSIGIGETYIPNRLKRGEVVDIVIAADSVLRQCILEGVVLAEGYTPIALSSIGMAVQSGAPKPDISSVDALRKTLLHAKSIAYSASVSGQYLTTELYQRLGIVDQVINKGHLVSSERIGAVVARGEAEIGFEQISELLPVPGIAHITPLPAEVQKVSTFSAGVAALCPDISVARSVIHFLASSEADKAISSSGLKSFCNR